jgi:hypothetical protein
MCKSKSGADHLDEATGACVCTTSSEARPFKTSMSYKHPNTPATCVDDPCNPNGVNVESGKACESEADCGGVCVDQQCHIPSDTVCRTDLDCSNQLRGMSQEVARCTRIGDDGLGVCATLDVQRARLGSTCTTDAHCSLGACTGEEGEKTCTGGCACANGFHQVPDGGMSPLGFTCVDDCIGKCKNGGVCVHLEDGGTECRCGPYNGGDTCEERLCARKYEYCDEQTPCCGHCQCNQADECCNQFPRETTSNGLSVMCIENVCQESTMLFSSCTHGGTNPRGCEDTAHLSNYSETPMQCNGWGIEGNDGCECHPTHMGRFCETALCSRQHEACEFDADCCNFCGCDPVDPECECNTYDSYDGPQACIGGKCKPSSNFNLDDTSMCVSISDVQWVVSIEAPAVGDVPTVLYGVQLVQVGTDWWMNSHPQQSEVGDIGCKLVFTPANGVSIHMEIGVVEAYEEETHIPDLVDAVGNVIEQGGSVTLTLHRLAPYYEDTIVAPGSYTEGRLCTPSKIMRGDSGSFLWVSSKTSQGSARRILDPSGWLKVWIAPNPSKFIVPHTMNATDDNIMQTHYKRQWNVERSRFVFPYMEGGLQVLNKPGSYMPVTPSYFGYNFLFVPTDEGVEVTLGIGNWTGVTNDTWDDLTFNPEGTTFVPDHSTQFTIPGATVEDGALVVDGTQNQTRITNPEDGSYVKFA